MKKLIKYKRLEEASVLNDKNKMLNFIAENISLVEGYELSDLYSRVALLKLRKDTDNTYWRLNVNKLQSEAFGQSEIRIDEPYPVVLKKVQDFIASKSQGKSGLDIKVKKEYIYAKRYIFEGKTANEFIIRDLSYAGQAFFGILYASIFDKIAPHDLVVELVDKYLKLPSSSPYLKYEWLLSGKVKIPELKNIEINFFKNKKVILKNISAENLQKFTNYINYLNERN